MKRLNNKTSKLKAFFTRIITNRILVGIVLNLVYFFGVIGTYFQWCVTDNMSDWTWWVKLTIFAILINVHRDIHAFITKHGW